MVRMSAKDQVSKLLDQLMGQNRDGEFPSYTRTMYVYALEFRGVDFSTCYICLSSARGRLQL